MKINKVVYSYSRTVQMRQFEPAVVFMSLEAQVDPTDKEETVIANLKKKVKTQVDADTKQLMEDRKANYDDELEKSV